MKVLDLEHGATTLAAPTRTNPPPALGQYWHGEGGIYVGLIRGENGLPDYHVIAHPDAFIEAVAWGVHGHDEPGATHPRDGLANTRALVESSIEHPAAKWAAGLTFDGHADFYLPSAAEIQLCRMNAPELFTGGWYWSSTQYSPYFAWIQDFYDGFQGNGLKYYQYHGRAVRRVLVL